MDKLVIQGGKKLNGTISVGGAKNAALPILMTSLLTDEKCSFRQVPDLHDIHTTLDLMKFMGGECKFDRQSGVTEIRFHNHFHPVAPYDLVRKMRASVLVLGPSLARSGRAKVSLPGGCAIGARPIDIHLEGLKKMGARLELSQGYILGQASRLRGERIKLEFPSVGATENLMMTAALINGETVLENAAQEPEIDDLALCLNGMGAEIRIEDSGKIFIQGRDRLRGADHQIMGDRIEAGTYLCAGLITGGSVVVEGCKPEWLTVFLDRLRETGARVTLSEKSIALVAPGTITPVSITTEPFPGFPTDLQAQWMATMSVASGPSVVTETIFENRFMHVLELNRLGADIKVQGRQAEISGVSQLKGAPVMATDLRASACLVLGGLRAEGETTVHRIYHLDRGYSHLERKLVALGADMERLPE